MPQSFQSPGAAATSSLFDFLAEREARRLRATGTTGTRSPNGCNHVVSSSHNNPAKLTDAETIARYKEWAAFGAIAGTCEVNGRALLNHNILAKNVARMTLTEKADIDAMDTDTFVAVPQQGEPNSGRRTTYSRIR